MAAAGAEAGGPLMVGPAGAVGRTAGVTSGAGRGAGSSGSGLRSTPPTPGLRRWSGTGWMPRSVRYTASSRCAMSSMANSMLTTSSRMVSNCPSKKAISRSRARSAGDWNTWSNNQTLKAPTATTPRARRATPRRISLRVRGTCSTRKVLGLNLLRVHMDVQRS